MESKVQTGCIIRNFLIDPFNKSDFRKFFQYCHSFTANYIHGLISKGWKIPVEDVDMEKAISNRAVEILGNFLVSRKGRHFYIIYDYFKSKNITDFKNIDPIELRHQFLILLCGFIKQELPKIIGAENPETTRLKKRIKEIINSPEYAVGRICGGSEKYVYLKKNETNLRKDRDRIDENTLHGIAEQAFMCSKNRSEWCSDIFKLIDDNPDVQNFCGYYILMQTMMAVNARHVELDGGYSAHIESQEGYYAQKTAETARIKTIEHVKNNAIKHFLNKKRISPEEAHLLLIAVDKYLTDYSYDGNTDPIPEYFREAMPPEAHARYLKDYKHIFETIIDSAKGFFDDYMKKNL